MIIYTATPDYYNNYISHYNHNHDPRNGQFSSGPGGSGSITKIKNKVREAVQGARRKTRKYKKDLDIYKTHATEKVYNKERMANSSNWLKESKTKKDKDFYKSVINDYKSWESNNQKYIDSFNKKYGQHNLEDVFSKEDAKNLRAKEKWADDILNKKQKVKDLNKDIKKVYKVAGSDFDGDGARVAKQKIDNEVKRARKTGMYNMEFLERNLDLDPVTEEPMKGKALDNAYRKFLEDELKRKSK